MAQNNSVDELFLNQTGTPPKSGGSGTGAEIVKGALDVGSAVLSASANKPEFKKYVQTKCGRKPFLAGKKKKEKYQQCSDSALKEYSSLGQASTPPPPSPPSSDGSGQTGDGAGASGTSGGGMSTNTILLIGGGVVVIGLIAFFVLRKK